MQFQEQSAHSSSTTKARRSRCSEAAPFELADDDLRIIGAYQGIFLTQLRELCDRTGGGRPERFKIDFVAASVFSFDLRDGYYLVLVADPSATEAIAWRELRACRERLLAEI
jgi:hypothetical protein